MSRLERLRQLRAAAMLNAERLPDDRRSYGDYLYKCVQAHTSQTG